MAKKQLKIPFKDGRPCKWVKDVHDEERDNYEFEECLEIHGFVRGCSSAVMILRPANDHGLVKVLPKIHKIPLDMIAKDIFRSENK